MINADQWCILYQDSNGAFRLALPNGEPIPNHGDVTIKQDFNEMWTGHCSVVVQFHLRVATHDEAKEIDKRRRNQDTPPGGIKD